MIDFLPFGAEYGLHPKWSPHYRWYIRLFGIVDLPTRIRFRRLARYFTSGEYTILDVGCGTGVYSFYFSRDKRCQVLGVDIDPGWIQGAQDIARTLQRPNLAFSAGEGLSTLADQPDNHFDRVLAVEVLSCVDPLDEMVQQLYRVLKPGGQLLGSIPVLSTLRTSEVNLFDPEAFVARLNEAGFQECLGQSCLGGPQRLLSLLFGKLQPHPWLVAILFPLLLVLGSLLPGTWGGKAPHFVFRAIKPTDGGVA
ncbi:MAG: class I SAM-dependent methyltransferase [Magnetococcales bacterium]|nr:class I SAM-dependent methyltransferase [Magnetococcales bacterium]